MDRKWLAYYFFCGLRIYYVLLPQTGYIHPDEFFQTVEVVAGDTLNINHHRAWEFNGTNAIRSITPAYLMSAIPFLAVKHLVETGILENSSYYCLVGPRLVMLLYSFILDICLYKLSRIFNLQASFVLMCHSISYITLIYQTRTFLNSLETVLVTIFILLVIQSVHQYKKIIKKKRGESKQRTKDMTSDSVSYKKKFKGKVMSERKYEIYDMVTVGSSYVIMMSIVSVVGIFNRPTFVAFVIGPGLWWLYTIYKCVGDYTPGNTPPQSNISILACKLQTTIWPIFRLLALGMVAVIATCFTMVAVDTVYYSELNLDICDNHISRTRCIISEIYQRIIITPWNFITYNTATDNLEQHGLHPRYLHLTVNLPLLFGPFAFIIYKCCIEIVWKYAVQSWRSVSQRKHHQSLDFPFCLTIVITVGLLSVFPHQEPRFLIPLLPIILLQVSDYFQRTSLAKHKQTLCSYNTTVFLWILFNASLSAIFGFWHQGAVTKSLFYFQQQNHERETGSRDSMTLIYFRTYMPPQHLLLDNKNTFLVKDLGGSDVETLENIIRNDGHPQRTMYIILPTTVAEVVQSMNVTVRLVERLSFHLSTENLPHLDFNCLFALHSITESYDCLRGIADNFIAQLTLSIFLVKQQS